MGRMNDSQFNQRVWRLLGEISRADSDEPARRILRQQFDLVTDRRFLPALFEILDAVGQRPNAMGNARSLGYFLAALARDVLLESSLARLGRGGAINALMASDSSETLRADVARLRSLLDDACFDEFAALRDDARQRGLSELAASAEMRSESATLLLSLSRLDELRNELQKTRSTHAAVEFLVQAARTMPRWFARGLDSALDEMESQNARAFELILTHTLRRARQLLTAGQKAEVVVKTLEADTSVQNYIEHYRAPHPESVPDLLAVHGEQEKERLLEIAQVMGGQMQALMRFAFADGETQARGVVAQEPSVLAREAEALARRFAADAARQQQFTLAATMERAADQIRAWLDEYARPERNAIARLAAQVRANEISLDAAQAQLREHIRELDAVALAAIDERAIWQMHGGALREAETLALLNHAAAQSLGNVKLQIDTAITLGQIKSELGEHRAAISILQQAEPLAQELDDAQRHVRVIGPLGTAYQELADYENARQFYTRALEIARGAEEEPLEAAAFGNLAVIEVLTGNYTRALELVEQSLAIAQRSGDAYQSTQGTSTRALVLHQLARYPEAFAAYDEALRALRELGDTNSEIRTRSHLAQAHLETGQVEKALAEFEHARTLAQNAGNLPLEASVISSLGGVYYYRGDFHRALQFFEQALEIEERLGLREKLATSLVNLAPIYLNLQQWDRARSVLERAARIAQEIGNARLAAHAQLGLGNYFLDRDDYAESAAAFERAQELARAQGDPQLELMAAGNLGRVQEMQNQLVQAAQTQSRVLDTTRRLGLSIQEAQALVSLGAVQAKLQDNERARETLAQAAQRANELGLAHDEYHAHRNLGLLYDSAFQDYPRALEHYQAAIQVLELERRALGEVEDFERRYLENKLDVYHLAAQALLQLERPLDALETLEQGRARLLARRLLRREALPPNVPGDLRARFTRTSEAVQFLRTIVHGEPSWGMKLVQETRLLGAELQGKPIDLAKEQQEYKSALADAEAELEKIIAAIRGYALNFGGAPLELPRLDFDELVRDETTAVVALVIGHSISRAIVLHPAGTRMVDLPDFTLGEVEHFLYGVPEPLAELYQQAQTQLPRENTVDRANDIAMYMHYMTLRLMIEETDTLEMGWETAMRTLISEKTQADQLEHIRRNLPSEPREKTLFDIDDAKRMAMWQRVFDVTARELKTRLWAPLLPVLRELNVMRVVMMPDANLHSLPLALGLREQVDAPAVMFAPSLMLYAQCAKWLREREPRENTLMLIANPTQDLGAANLEARLLRELFAAHGELTFALNETQATQQNVLRTCRVGGYWHFAGHARYVWQNPALSGLSLANGETLPLYWIPMWMDLRATRLACLSACETAMTPARDAAQEFAGLFSSFLIAGAPTVLASLYPVENISTALLAHRFYQYHLGDPRENISARPPAVALRDAQTWLRELTYAELRAYLILKLDDSLEEIWIDLLGLERRVKADERPFENPYFWAGFVLAGA
jgi:CHAT domain-containing protein